MAGAAHHQGSARPVTAIKGELSWIDAPEQWVDTRMRLLAAAPVNAAGDTVASVYAYAVGQMPPPPGANPAAVTDAFIRYALADVQP